MNEKFLRRCDITQHHWRGSVSTVQLTTMSLTTSTKSHHVCPSYL